MSPKVSFSQDNGIRFIIEQAKSLKWVHKVLIFGSRAKNEATEFSDFDIAVETYEKKPKEWPSFALYIREHFPVARKLDLVHLNTAQKKLREKIMSEGVVCYERKDSVT